MVRDVVLSVPQMLLQLLLRIPATPGGIPHFPGGLGRALDIDGPGLRFRAFILGVVPLMTAAGAGSEMRAAIGTAVFFGMLGVTVFGLLFTPVFYVVIRRLTGTRESNEPAVERPAAAE